jgi:glycosyltransferase involved in cell wall biosynthesis
VSETHVLYLAEGNSETPESWSGCSRGVVRAMRAHGAAVDTVDVLPGPMGKWLSIGLSFHPNRERWAARYHSGGVGVSMRSAAAARAIRRHAAGAPVLQAGATFLAKDLGDHPLFIYCDANAIFASHGKPYSSVGALEPAALKATVEAEHRIYTKASGIFTFSEALRQSFIKDYAIAPERVRTVYAGSNLFITPDDAILARRTGGPPTILFVGKAFERKGGDDLLAAFRLVRAEMPDARLIIAGASPDGAGEGVEIVGYVDPTRTGPGSLSELYGRADVFCMPSRYEPFGVVFVEAMLHGLPCVGVDAWAMPEIISAGRTGWLAPAGNVGALADILVAALRYREKLRPMGAEGRERALRLFTWSRVGEAILAGMRELGGASA